MHMLLFNSTEFGSVVAGHLVRAVQAAHARAAGCVHALSNALPSEPGSFYDLDSGAAFSLSPPSLTKMYARTHTHTLVSGAVPGEPPAAPVLRPRPISPDFTAPCVRTPHVAQWADSTQLRWPRTHGRIHPSHPPNALSTSHLWLVVLVSGSRQTNLVSEELPVLGLNTLCAIPPQGEFGWGALSPTQPRFCSEHCGAQGCESMVLWGCFVVTVHYQLTVTP